MQSVDEKLLKTIYLIRISFPHSKTFYYIFFILKVLGIILSSHNIKGHETRESDKDFTIASMIEKLLLYQKTFSLVKRSYQIVSIILWIFLVYPVLHFCFLYTQISSLYKERDNWIRYNYHKKLRPKGYKVSAWILSYVLWVILIMSQHILEYLSFGIIVPFMDSNFKTNNTSLALTYSSDAIPSLNSYFNTHFLNSYMIFAFNIISTLWVWMYFFIFLEFNNIKSLHLKAGTSWYSNKRNECYLLIIILFHPITSIQNIYNTETKSTNKLIICCTLFSVLSLFLFINFKKFNYYDGHIQRMIFFVSIWSWYSSLFEWVIYYTCDNPFTQLDSFWKSILELISSLITFLIFRYINWAKFEQDFSVHLFQEMNKNYSIGDMYIYMNKWDTFIRKTIEYSGWSRLIHKHKEICQRPNCTCSILKGNDNKQENTVTILSKLQYIIIGEQEIVNRIVFKYKKKVNSNSSTGSLEDYCFLHVTYIYYIKKHYNYALYLVTMYLTSNKIKFSVLNKYYLYELKKQIMKELFNESFRNKKWSDDGFPEQKKLLAINWSNKEMFRQMRKFIHYLGFLEGVKAIMINCWTHLEMICHFKNDWNQHPKFMSLPNKESEFWLSWCEKIMIGNKNIEDIILSFWYRKQPSASEWNRLNYRLKDKELSYWLYNYFAYIYKEIPEGLRKNFLYIKEFHSSIWDNFSFSHDNWNQFCLDYPMILHLNQTSGFVISYINSKLCSKLNYSKEKVINESINILIPQDISQYHDLLLNQFVFISNAHMTKENGYILNSNFHWLNCSITGTVLPCLQYAFYWIMNIEIKEDNNNDVITYDLIVNENFKILSVSQNFEEQFFFNLKMFDVLKVNFCDFFAVGYNKLMRKFKQYNETKAKQDNLSEKSKGNRIFSNIKPDKMFSYRKICLNPRDLFNKAYSITETIKKSQIWEGCKNWLKIMDDIGWDIDWYNRVKCLCERLQIQGSQNIMSMIDSSQFEAQYTMKMINNTKYYVVKLKEYIDVKEIWMNAWNIRETYLSKGDKNLDGVFNMSDSNNSQSNGLLSIPLTSPNWAPNTPMTKSIRTSNNFIEETNQKNSNNTHFVQGMFNKLNQFNASNNSNGIGLFQGWDNTSSSNNGEYSMSGSTYNLARTCNNNRKHTAHKHLLNKKSKKDEIPNEEASDQRERIGWNIPPNKRYNLIYNKIIFFTFILWLALTIGHYITKLSQLSIHQDWFYINIYVVMIKTDLYLSASAMLSICEQIASESINWDFIKIRLNNGKEGLNEHWGWFLFYWEKFRDNNKTKKWFSIIYEKKQYNILDKNWETSLRNSTFLEEINWYHYYWGLNSNDDTLVCRYYDYFLNNNYNAAKEELNWNDISTFPSTKEFLVHYLLQNVILNYKPVFESITNELMEVLLYYYSFFTTSVFAWSVSTAILGLFLLIVIIKKLKNDIIQTVSILSKLYIHNNDERIFEEKITRFKAMLLDFRKENIILFEKSKSMTGMKGAGGYSISIPEDWKPSTKHLSSNRSSARNNNKVNPKSSGKSRVLMINDKENKVNSINNSTSSTSVNNIYSNVNKKQSSSLLNVQFPEERDGISNRNKDLVPKFLIISMWTCSGLFCLLVLILGGNIVFSSISEKQFIYEMKIGMNFIERIPKTYELFFYADQSVIFNDPNSLTYTTTTNDLNEEFKNKYWNYFDINLNIDKNSQWLTVKESLLFKLYFESKYIWETIKMFVADTKNRDIWSNIREWENNFNLENNLCIYSSLGAVYSTKANFNTTQDWFKELNFQTVICHTRCVISNINGLKGSFDFIYQELTNSYSDFANAPKGDDRVIKYYKNENMFLIKRDFEISYHNVFLTFSYFLIQDFVYLYSFENLFEQVFSIGIFLAILLTFIYVYIGIVKRNEHYKTLLNYFVHLFYHDVGADEVLFASNSNAVQSEKWF